MYVCVFVCLYIGDVDRTSHESHEEQREDGRGESQYGWLVSLSYCSNILDGPVQDFKTDLVIRRIIVCMPVSALMVPEFNITTKYGQHLVNYNKFCPAFFFGLQSYYYFVSLNHNNPYQSN